MKIENENKIIEILAEDSSANVNDISKLLNVSLVTVRSYLTALEEKGLIVRTKGGTLPAFHPSIIERQKNMMEEKKRIAKSAAGLVKDGDTIMIDAGTTTALIAKYLLGKRDIHIVSNSSFILPYVRINPSIHLTLTGGEFRPATESFVGPITLRELEQFHVSMAFIGTDGFKPETGLTTHLLENAEAVRKMSEKAVKTVLVADSSKFGKSGFVHVLPLDALDILVTDTGLENSALKILKETGIEVILV